MRAKANPFVVALGKGVRVLARLRGGGSAFPGMVVERLDKDFAVDILGSLPYGVVVVSGTNGKTTTAKIVTELLQASGLRVFTNPTGSNFMRGVISALLPKISLTGRLNADIAVLELDEAHAVLFVERIKPRFSLLLNVMRDQLDRFGEIDYTVSLLATVARNTVECVVLNANDERLTAIATEEHLNASVQYFDLAPELRASFPTDDALYDDALCGGGSSADCCGRGGGASGSDILALRLNTRQALLEQTPDIAHTAGGSQSSANPVSLSECHWHSSRALDPSPSSLSQSATLPPKALVVLQSLESDKATFNIDGERYTTSLNLKGVYNTYNAAAALALVKVVLRAITALHPEAHILDNERLLDALSRVSSAFGRGEVIDVNGTQVELFLVKNPGGFRLALESFDASGHDTMIAINDEYADGRDMSWLFDVNFATLTEGVTMVSGIRAWDMALRLAYDDIEVAAVQPDLAKACDTFLAGSPKPKRIYCTYTAMLAIRSHLATLAPIERVL